MFNLFKKKKPRESDSSGVADLFTKFIKPTTTAIALDNILTAHLKDIRNGSVEFPAQKDEKAGLVSMWARIRLECFIPFQRHGCADLSLLATMSKQRELLTIYYEEKPHLELPHTPSMSPEHDSLQAILQVYQYLSKIGSELCDPQTDSLNLRTKKQTITDEFESGLEQLKLELSALSNNNTSEEVTFPKTIFEIIFTDVTSKAKSIALSVKLGPLHDLGLEDICKTITDSGGDSSEVEGFFDEFFKSNDPDDFNS